jgi:prepilin peptidase CpaA
VSDFTAPFHALFIACMIYAAVTDLVTFRIFNRVILILLAAFALFAVLNGWVSSQSGWEHIGWHLLAGVAGFVFFLIFYAIGQMGAGDVKLFAAIALWFGWTGATLNYVLYALVAGGVLTLILLLWRKAPLPQWMANIRFLKRLHIRKLKTPYGISLGITAIWVSFFAPVFA